MVAEHRAPIRTVSRAAARKRSGKMRIMWFVVGSSFGIACTSLITSSLSPMSAPNIAEIADVQPQAQETQPQDLASTAAPAPSAPVVDAPAQEVALVMPGSEVPSAPEPAQAAAQPQLAQDEPQTPASGPAPALTYPIAMNLEVENGDTLIDILKETGVSYDEAQSAIQSIRKVYDPKKLDVGDKITVSIDRPADSPETLVIANLVLPMSLTSSVELTRTDTDNFSVRTVQAPTERKVARASGKIDSSLYETAVKNGLTPALVSELITAFSYDVDFQRDIRQGDKMDVLFERVQTADGTRVGQGNLIYAQLDLGNGKPLRIYRYTDKNGHSEYYTETGESVRKALLRTPINGAKITSGFGMRNHPILGYSKMHRGVDFAAPTGTPIYASGDGTVEFVGRKGGYGNYVRIRHNSKYASAYAHVSRFASGMMPGKRVKQGQIIAYVGSTGQSTGPHLHYEILVNNEQVNPANVKFKTGNALAGKELAAFKKSVAKIDSKLASIPNGKASMAMADFEREVYRN